jgi:hypothetical protein
LDEKEPQTSLRRFKVLGIHRSEYGIRGNTLIKPGDELLEKRGTTNTVIEALEHPASLIGIRTVCRTL